MSQATKRVRLALPASLGVIGLGYFVAMSQLPVFFALKVPLAALPLQIAALGYVAWYWRRRSRRQRQLNSEHLF